MDKKKIVLDNPVVTRKVPMTERGNDLLREFRKRFESEYMSKKGEDVNIPFPTVIHLALEKLAHLEGIKVGRK
ncbi:hypothetical protein PQC39_gp066 [Vibrio phage Vp_R1]|uniref:Uncharacterized protein n=1 Tax=Vibrio phage Vp_R1 TaxID=2059867 RepID=A0A2H5BQ22_9CAUD|nr:hypothetical protein PQC39_gp066 [Vibrio phage Vp_R1]AUG88430.1 hypothetical protein VPR_066 [Vibrio phage Vp_R1]